MHTYIHTYHAPRGRPRRHGHEDRGPLHRHADGRWPLRRSTTTNYSLLVLFNCSLQLYNCILLELQLFITTLHRHADDLGPLRGTG